MLRKSAVTMGWLRNLVSLHSGNIINSGGEIDGNTSYNCPYAQHEIKITFDDNTKISKNS